MSEHKKTAISYLIFGVVMAIFAIAFGVYATGTYQRTAETYQETAEAYWQTAEVQWQMADEIYQEIYQVDRTNGSEPLVTESDLAQRNLARLYNSSAWLDKSLYDSYKILADKYRVVASVYRTGGVGFGAVSLILFSKGIGMLFGYRQKENSDPV